MKNTLKLKTLIISAIFLMGCEDDPILTPTVEEGEECTGSYCRLQLDIFQPWANQTQSTVFHWELNSSNPEVF